MSEVKRYNSYAEGLLVHFEADSEGAWVGAPDYDSAQSQLAALREELATAKSVMAHDYELLQQRLADAERRNDLPADWSDQLFAEMERRFDLRKQIDDDHMVNDDTQIGVEFAIEWISAALNPKPEAASHE